MFFTQSQGKLRKLSHLLNEIFPKLNSMIELIESLYLSLFQPLLSILNYLFSSLKSLVLSFFVLNADKIEPEFSASLNILSDAFLFDGKSSKSLFHWTKKSQFDRGDPQNPLNIAKWILLFAKSRTDMKPNFGVTYAK